jgi:23S rRNA (uridine2552-2'-O)-methyltransferase
MTKSKTPKSRRASGPGADGRALKVKVKKAKGRSTSSVRWLDRQLNDPYVAAAKRDGLRSRAAYKLMEIDDAHSILQPAQTVVDLGAAPGGWSQIAANRVNAGTGAGRVIAVDLLAMEALPGVDFIQLDFDDEHAPLAIEELLGGAKVDVVLSDMAAASTGHRQTDHLRIVGLCEEALDFARTILKPGGTFLAKVLQGGTEKALLTAMKQDFERVRHVKPQASRAQSSELYVLAQGFRATAKD